MDTAQRDPRPPHRHWRVWLLSFTIWSLPVVVFSVTPVVLQPEPSIRKVVGMLITQGMSWYTWALFTPVVLGLAQRWPIGIGQFRRNLVRHLSAATLMGIAFNAVFMGTIFFVRGADMPPEENMTLARILVTGLVFWLPFSYMIYTLVASVGTSFEYYRRLRDREIAASRLEARLMEAQLSALRMQLQPHFLFNALNTVAMLVRQGDTRTSVRMIARLSELLRHVLDESGEPEIRLERELLLVQRYLEIEQLRFGERMIYESDVAPDVNDALVPNLLLQPIVENAVRHGISRSVAAGRVRLRAFRDGEQLCLEVSDDGPGLAPDALRNGGIGVSNTRARLEHLYGERAAFQIENAAPTGVRVRITLPYHTAEPAVAVTSHG